MTGYPNRPAWPCSPHSQLGRPHTHRQQVSQGHGEANGKRSRTPEVPAPPICGGEHAQHELQGANDLDAQALTRVHTRGQLSGRGTARFVEQARWGLCPRVCPPRAHAPLCPYSPSQAPLLGPVEGGQSPPQHTAWVVDTRLCSFHSIEELPAQPLVPTSTLCALPGGWRSL